MMLVLNRFIVLLFLVTNAESKDQTKVYQQVANILKHQYIGAITNFLTALQRKVGKELTANERLRLKICSNVAKENIKSKAKCLTEAFEQRRLHRKAVLLGGGVKMIGSFMVCHQCQFTRSKRDGVITRQRNDVADIILGESSHSFDVQKAKPGFHSRTRRDVKKMAHMPNLALSRMAHHSTGYMIARMLRDFMRTGQESTRNTLSWREKFRKLRRYKSLVKKITMFQARDYISRKVVNGNSDRDFVTELMNVIVNAAAKTQGTTSFRLFSPKLLSVVNNDNDNGFNLFSPNFLSLDDSSKAVLSLPHLLDGLSAEEREAWLELIMEASGAGKSVDKVLDFFKEPTPKTQQERILLATVKLSDGWDRVHEKNTYKQRIQLKNDGYTFLERDQLEMLYGPQGLYNISSELLDIDTECYSQMSDSDREEALENIIRSIAGKGLNPALKSWSHRLKQTTLEPFIFEPEIVHPVVLGPVTLSPSIFSPKILAPKVLSPETLSPAVGNPIILSPYVLGPVTLSPQVMQPFVLSPYALSPNILTPFVLSPLILNPFVLSPEILSPQVLGGLILSPNALSPPILSPTVLFADVLSPSVLSGGGGH